MQAIAVVFDPVQDLAAVVIVGNIGGQPMDATVGKRIDQLIAGDLQRIGIAPDDQHIGAEPEQFPRNGQADAGTGAGDQCGLSVQSPTLRAHMLLLRRGPAPCCPRPAPCPALCSG
ncbi:hypothetical protein D3C71_1468410 [compost metagenome]